MKLFLDSYLCGGDVDSVFPSIRLLVFFRNVKVL